MQIRISGTILVSTLLIAIAMGCREEGPAEKLGRKVDDVTGQANGAIDRASERAGNAIDQAGDAIDRASEKAKKKLGGD
ncbi:MAG: hypothetical protein VCB99_03220 [Myxococcota bacterium]